MGYAKCMKRSRLPVLTALAALMMSACATVPTMMTPFNPTVTVHRDNDDLLTAGLGLKGLQSMTPPPIANAEAPTAQELRRRAIYANWRGIADLAPGGGFGDFYGSTANVPGREFAGTATVPGAKHPHRVLAQIPDGFDQVKRCLVVAPSSGSRGVYGAIAVAAPWGLPKGCAVAYTDKGTGTDYFDVGSGSSSNLSGQRATGADRLFVPEVSANVQPHEVAIKHAHSQDNPEASWGEHVVQAAQFGLQSLGAAFPDQAPFTFENTKVIAVGISNGGGAVLRAAENANAKFAAVVAGEPNVFVDGYGSRSLMDYGLEAWTLMACAQLALPDGTLPEPPLLNAAKPIMGSWCQRLKMAGVLNGNTVDELARDAYSKMIAKGWTDGSLTAGFASTGFDLWRAVLAGYISAYAKAPVGANPCGFRYVTEDSKTKEARATTVAERAAWWSDASGIPPGNGIALKNDQVDVYQQIQCVAEKAKEATAAASLRATQAGMPHGDTPVLVMHGRSDGLLPINMTSIPYYRKAQAEGKTNVVLWNVANAQHFDGFLGFPGYGARFVPLLPYVYRGLDMVMAHLQNPSSPLPKSLDIETTPRGAGKPLTPGHLNLPR